MNYPAFTNDSLTMMYEGIRGALASDDALSGLGEEARFRVRETPEWKPTNPKRFLPVSVTGSACALSCDHCQSKVLEGMISVKAGENLLLKIPLIKVVYRSLKDLFGLFSDDKNREALQVVSVQLPGTDMRLLGFLILMLAVGAMMGVFLGSVENVLSALAPNR